jgi:hypothetical protein
MDLKKKMGVNKKYQYFNAFSKRKGDIHIRSGYVFTNQKRPTNVLKISKNKKNKKKIHNYCDERVVMTIFGFQIFCDVSFQGWGYALIWVPVRVLGGLRNLTPYYYNATIFSPQIHILGLLSTIRKLSVLFITFFHTRKTSD